MITNGDVADLRPGDVVRVTGWDEGVTIEGPVARPTPSGALWVGSCLCLTPRRVNREWMDREQASLTVVSRAPRPLYVNSDRAEPVPGDVVRDADNGRDKRLWVCRDTDDECWYGPIPAGAKDCEDWRLRGELPRRLRLLVDGETGRAVAS